MVSETAGQIPTAPLLHATLGVCLHFSAPWFPYFQNGDNENTCVPGLLWRFMTQWLRKHSKHEISQLKTCPASRIPSNQSFHSTRLPVTGAYLRILHQKVIFHHSRSQEAPYHTVALIKKRDDCEIAFQWTMEKHRIIFAAAVSVDYGENKRSQSCRRDSPSVSPNSAL